MRTQKGMLSLIFGLGIAISCAPMKTQLQETYTKASDVVDGQLIVKFKSGSDNKLISQVLGQFANMDPIDAANGIYLIKDSRISGSEKSFIQKIESQPGVDFVEPNYRLSVNQTTFPRDPMWLQLWGLKNHGQDAPGGIEGTVGADIGALEAWQKTTGDKSIVVAVLDTGIDYLHPDLVQNIWVNQPEKNGVPGVDDDGNGYVDDIHGWNAVSDFRTAPHFGQVGSPNPMDDQSHGTHVAGTIGAVGGNGIGVVGINWKVSLMPVKFLDANGSGSTIDEYRAIKYILSNNVDIVNGSYGGGASSKLIRSLIDEAGKKNGTLFVFAAGNDSNNNDFTDSFPSNYDLPNIISVAATDIRDQMAGFSNFGPTKVHIAAPGLNILSTIPTATAKEGEPYAVFSGTSMAAPHVAGAAALLLAAEPTLKKQPALIKERLLRTAEFKPNLASAVSSAGRLSISRAIKNDSSGNPNYQGQWDLLNVNIETPKNARERIDNAWKIQAPGAKAMKVHIKFAQVESGFDVAVLYDRLYRPIFKIEGEMVNQWSPIIDGDVAYLKFSNSVVSVDGGAPFANFNSDGVVIDQISYLKAGAQ